MSLPKYFKDSTGFCYAATELLSRDPDMTPWDGAINANGFAVDVPETTPTKRRARKAAAEDPEAQADALLSEIAHEE